MAQGRSSIVITVFSTTSGIGKTVVAINLAAGLAKEGYAVCLIDLDLQYGDVANFLHLPIADVPTILDVQDAMSRRRGAFDVEQYLSRYSYNNVSFAVLPAPRHIEDFYRVEEKGVIAILNHLDNFHFVIVDTHAEFTDMNMAVMDASTIINFLCVADFVPAIKNLKNGYEAILRFGYDTNKVRPVLNRSDSQTLIDYKDVEIILGKNFYHKLSNDFRATTASIHNGCPLILSDTSSKLKKDFNDLVGLYLNRPQVPTVKTADNGNLIQAFFKKVFRL